MHPVRLGSILIAKTEEKDCTGSYWQIVTKFWYLASAVILLTLFYVWTFTLHCKKEMTLSIMLPLKYHEHLYKLDY